MTSSPTTDPYRGPLIGVLRRGWLGGTVRQAHRLLSNTGTSAQARSSLNVPALSWLPH
jgi:hypothetical protein